MERTVHIAPPARWAPFRFRELIQYRDLFYFLVLRDLTVVYKQTVFGFGWAVGMPFVQMIVFSIIFGRLLGVQTDGSPYPLFSYAALIPWSYFNSAVSSAATSLIQGGNIYTKVYFPRLFIPMTPVASKLADFAIASLFLLVMMAYYKVTPGYSVIALPLLVLLLVLTALGCSLWLAALAVKYRDVRHASSLMLQLMMYAAPIVWSTSSLDENVSAYYAFYPVAGIVEGFRAAFLGTQSMPWEYLAKGFTTSLLIAISGLYYFTKRQDTFADLS